MTEIVVRLLRLATVGFFGLGAGSILVQEKLSAIDWSVLAICFFVVADMAIAQGISTSFSDMKITASAIAKGPSDGK